MTMIWAAVGGYLLVGQYIICAGSPFDAKYHIILYILTDE